MSYLKGCLSPLSPGELPLFGVPFAFCLKLCPLLTLLRVGPSYSPLLCSSSSSACLIWLFLAAPRMLSLNSSVIVFKWFPFDSFYWFCSLLSFRIWFFLLLLFWFLFLSLDCMILLRWKSRSCWFAERSWYLAEALISWSLSIFMMSSSCSGSLCISCRIWPPPRAA